MSESLLRQMRKQVQDTQLQEVRMTEQLANMEAQKKTLIQKITAKGYNPNNLSVERASREQRQNQILTYVAAVLRGEQANLSEITQQPFGALLPGEPSR